ncbi:MAG: pilus assembly protein N-terminal domain-containing protein [Planctomycetaceae bacterium]|nr:pilus assembly protein N-terminal domain-containing protein [Planctomycetaceae bacterium]
MRSSWKWNGILLIQMTVLGSLSADDQTAQNATGALRPLPAETVLPQLADHPPSAGSEDNIGRGHDTLTVELNVARDRVAKLSPGDTVVVLEDAGPADVLPALLLSSAKVLAIVPLPDDQTATIRLGLTAGQIGELETKSLQKLNTRTGADNVQFRRRPTNLPKNAGNAGRGPKLVECTFEFSADQIEGFKVGDLVDVLAQADWPVPYQHTLVTNVPILHIGPVEAGRPVEVELGLKSHQGREVVAQFAGDKPKPNYLQVRLLKNADAGQSDAPIASPVPTAPPVTSGELQNWGIPVPIDFTGTPLSGGTTVPNPVLTPYETPTPVSSSSWSGLSCWTLVVDAETWEPLRAKLPSELVNVTPSGEIVAVLNRAELTRLQGALEFCTGEIGNHIRSTLSDIPAPASVNPLTVQRSDYGFYLPDSRHLILETDDGDPQQLHLRLSVQPRPGTTDEKLTVAGPTSLQAETRLGPDEGLLLALHPEPGAHADSENRWMIVTVLPGMELDVQLPPSHVAPTGMSTATPDPAKLRVVPAGDQDPDAVASIDISGQESTQLTLAEGSSTRIELRDRIRIVDGFDPRVVAVTAADPRHLTVRGESTGTTSIRIIDEHGAMSTVDVSVESPDATALQRLLKRLYPERSVEVIHVNSVALLLRGQVTSEEERTQFLEIARNFAPTVLDQLQLQGSVGAKPPAIPAGMRVLAIPIDESHGPLPTLQLNAPVDLMLTYQRRDETGRMQTNTTTLIESAVLFAFGERTEQPHGSAIRIVQILVPAEFVSAVRRAETVGQLSLSHSHRPSQKPILNSSYAAELSEFTADLREFSQVQPHDLSTVRALNGTPDDATGEASPHSPPSAGTPATPQVEDSLHDDIRALHTDVRRLIELLERRTSQPESDANDEGSSASSSSAATEIPPQGDCLVYFHAAWCSPCKTMNALLDAFSREHPTQRVIRLNVDSSAAAVRTFGITAVPTLLRVADGTEVERHIGLLSPTELRDFAGIADHDSSPEANLIPIRPGHVSIVRSENRIVRLALDRPEVAQIIQYDERTIGLLGAKVGQCNLSMSMSHDEPAVQIPIRVDSHAESAVGVWRVSGRRLDAVSSGKSIGLTGPDDVTIARSRMPIQRVALGNEQIVSVTVRPGVGAELRGLQSGSTTLHLWSSVDELPSSFEIHVGDGGEAGPSGAAASDDICPQM